MKSINRKALAGMVMLFAMAGALFLLAGRQPKTTKRGTMIFETMVVGPLGVNCFILGDPAGREGIIVDPGAEPERILAVVKRHGLTIGQVINTHGHFDHVGANRAIVAATGARLLIHRGDEPLLGRAGQTAIMYGLSAENSPAPDAYLEDGMVLRFGSRELRVIHTPGHTPGGCCLFLAGEGILLSGDTLFAESIGRTDLPGGSAEQLAASIKAKLYPLPEATSVYPGHGPGTTIGHEKTNNPYVR
jgi:glyoxylase-like metal-dependent hydrolase (beta-lactamase superfamily II)